MSSPDQILPTNLYGTWKCPKGWKYHGKLLEVAMISMMWRGHDFSSDIEFTWVF